MLKICKLCMGDFYQLKGLNIHLTGSFTPWWSLPLTLYTALGKRDTQKNNQVCSDFFLCILVLLCSEESCSTGVLSIKQWQGDHNEKADLSVDVNHSPHVECLQWGREKTGTHEADNKEGVHLFPSLHLSVPSSCIQQTLSTNTHIHR